MEIRQAIKMYLDCMAQQDQDFALVYANKDKSLDHEEGIAMHHCVGGYYNRPQSLILSAKVDGKRVETIEVDLNSYRVVQSRGLQNKSTKYHDRIVSLVNKNMNEIINRNKIAI